MISDMVEVVIYITTSAFFVVAFALEHKIWYDLYSFSNVGGH